MAEPVREFLPKAADGLIEEVIRRSGQNLLACYQCRRCAAGCPVGDETKVTPDRLIRMIVTGDKDKALNNLLVWKCVACYTCGERCPNEIQTARINEALKQMAKERHLEPLSPKIAAFHEAFMSAARHFGRVNELEFMGLYELKNVVRDVKRGNFKALFEEFLSQARLGLPMLKQKRMHFGLDRVKSRGEISRLYQKAKTSHAGRK